MLSTIYAANKRVQRLRKAGYTNGDSYSRAQAQIAKSRGESPFHPKHTALKQTGSTKDLKAAFKAAQSILKDVGTRYGVVKKQINVKRNKTFRMEKGVKDVGKSFYALLNSDAFKHMSEVVGSSDQVLSMVITNREKGNSWKSIKNKLENFDDKYYTKDITIEELKDLLQGEEDNEIDPKDLPW